MNSGYGPALRRFWWIIVLGAVFAMALAVIMIYSVSGFPPKFTARDQPLYTAEVRMFVTSGEAPYLRTSVPRFTDVPIGSDGTSTERPIQQVLDPPDTRTLVAATNVYPLLIESDDVAALRTKMFGEIEGEIVAQAIFAAATAARYQPSEIPVIELFATSDSPKDAIALAGATSKAFRAWMAREQGKAKIDPKQRILIQELEAPDDAIATGGAGIGLPILAMLAVLSAFAAGAIMLDRLFPRPEDHEGAASSDDPSADVREKDALDRHVGISETG